MTVTVKLFSDAAGALEKCVKALAALGNAFVGGARKGVEVAGWKKSRDSKGNLVNLSADLTQLRSRCKIIMLGGMEDFRSRPSPENWEKVRQEVQASLELVQKLTEDLRGNRDSIVTADFYIALSEGFAARQKILAQIAQMPAPATKNELAAYNVMTANYGALVLQLDKAVRALNAFIDRRPEQAFPSPTPPRKPAAKRTAKPKAEAKPT